jgi:hypothetical protein
MTNTLLDMLTYRRPMGSPAERKFRNRYLLNLPGAFEDTYGNIHVTVGDSRCLWSCHTDTVHQHSGRQRISVDGQFARLMDGQRSSCLGADDTVGIYLLREMILAGVPGCYVFHYGEERGGIGSRALAKHHGEFLAQNFDMAIALDRRGTRDVITHQSVGRTCSDLFARSLATALNDCSGLTYAASSQGVYTDTAEYADLIPECTNLSVGYQFEHTSKEYVDLSHVARLRAALLALDTTALTVARDPKVCDYESAWDRSAWATYDRWTDGTRSLTDADLDQMDLADYYARCLVEDLDKIDHPQDFHRYHYGHTTRSY